MQHLNISEATEEELYITAAMISSSEPWITLGTTLDTCLKFCLDQEYKVFVARFGSEICGAMVIHPRGLASSPYLKSIVVGSNFRSMGIGRELLRFAEEYFRKTSMHFFMCVSSFNPMARALYEKLGYTKVGEFADYILDGQSEILLHKRIR